MAAVNQRRRGTRANPVGDENAVPTLAAARSSRIATGKDAVLRPRATSTAAAGKTTITASASEGSKGIALAGRKRTALGLVTNDDKVQIGGSKAVAEDGDLKELHKEPLKEKTTTQVTRQTRPALAPRARSQSTTATTSLIPRSDSGPQIAGIRPPTRRTRRSSVAVVKPSDIVPAPSVENIQEEDDDAMEVDQPEPSAPAPVRPLATRRTSTRLSAVTSTGLASTSTGVPTSSGTTAKLIPRSKTTTSLSMNGATRPIAGNAATRRSKVIVPPPKPVVPDVVEEDEQPPVKKRRTSSMDADEQDEVQPRARSHKIVEVVISTREVKRKVVQPKPQDVSTTPRLKLVAKQEVAPPVVEPRPKDYGWKNMDDGDEGNEGMVQEYSEDVFAYIRELEIKTMPNPNYMDTQRELSWKMRSVLVDWLVTIHGQFRLLPETLFLCFNIMDRFLSVRVVSVIKYQLVGAAALLLAAKYEEPVYPSVANIIAQCDEGYDERQLLSAEAYILKNIGFDLSYPGPMSFLRRTSKAESYELQSRTLAKYFVEIASVDWRLIDVKPSLATAASFYLSRLILERGSWNPTLVHYSGYSEQEVLPVVIRMVAYILREPEHDAFFKKYARRMYLKVSLYARDWAVGKFPGQRTVTTEEIVRLQGDVAKRAAELGLDDDRFELDDEDDA